MDGHTEGPAHAREAASGNPGLGGGAFGRYRQSVRRRAPRGRNPADWVVTIGYLLPAENPVTRRLQPSIDHMHFDNTDRCDVLSVKALRESAAANNRKRVS
jgi:hypothetical protein